MYIHTYIYRSVFSSFSITLVALARSLPYHVLLAALVRVFLIKSSLHSAPSLAGTHTHTDTHPHPFNYILGNTPSIGCLVAYDKPAITHPRTAPQVRQLVISKSVNF